jgi:hypothetical protein
MRKRAAATALALLALAAARTASAGDDATLFRLFLHDGTTLVSYGEFSRIGDHVVFAMPTAATPNPPLQLASIPADRVDWDHTERYAQSARANRYFVTQGESDYAELSGVLVAALNEVASVTDPSHRLSIVENARKTLVEWSESHYHYRQKDVQQMLSMLDEAIADLRVAAGGPQFHLSLVTVAEAPTTTESLLPAPTAQEAIEGVLTAARVAGSGADRQALLEVAVAAIDRDRTELPPRWAIATRASAIVALEDERRLDRAYRSLAQRLIALSARRARDADVRGALHVLDLVHANDVALGLKRPEVVVGAIAAITANVDTARRLRLEREAWVLRMQDVRRYQAAIDTPLKILDSLVAPLKDIKELAGSSEGALALLGHQVKSLRLLLATVVPPEECRSVHSLLASAAQLAGDAARMRGEAARAGDIGRAWDASAAAAGALMLTTRAKMEIQALVRLPTLP